MKVETEELPDSQVALSMEIEDERLEQAMEAAYRRVAGRVNIAGFRRGKAPRSLVERVVGRESLMEEALEHLLPEAFEEAAQIAQIKALTEPEFDVESMTPLKAKAVVVVRPPVELGDYRSIHHDPKTADLDNLEVDKVLDQLRDDHAEWVPADRPVAMGDRVAIDVVGTAEDKQVLKRDDIEYLIEEDNPTPVPGFAAQLVGMSAGDTKTFELDAPEHSDHPGHEEHENDPAAGKKTEFNVTVKDVKAKELPELDDYFATTVGTYKDLDELRAQVTEQMRTRVELSSRLEREAEVLKEALDAASVSLPDKLVNHHAHRMRDRLARELDSRGLTIEQYQRIRHTSDEDLDAEFRSDAERSLKRSFVLQAIAEQEQLTVSEDQIDTNIREAFGSDGGGDSRAVERALRQEEIRERIRSALIEEQAAKWLVEHAITAETVEPTTAAEAVEQAAPVGSAERATTAQTAETAGESGPPPEVPAPEAQEQHP